MFFREITALVVASLQLEAERRREARSGTGID